jgi:hypothetical protein
MSDNRRRYRAIKNTIKQLYPTEPKGNTARHLQTLAALISGIVGSRRSNLPAIAGQVPDGSKQESRVKKYYRWMINERIDAELYFVPFADALLMGLAHRPLVLVMDGSEVGRNCLVLMLSVIYRKRALPLAWIVIEGNKGHFPEQTHVELLMQVQALIPEQCTVIFLGDGEFDGITLQATLEACGWQYVCRTAKNTQLFADGERFAFQDLILWPGDCLGVFDALFTLQDYGPVLAITVWDQAYKDPLYLVTNMELVDEARYWYRKRFRIETFFSDQKTRGFHLHKSHISDPARLSRLMIAACLAYIWIIFLGTLSILEDWVSIIHRTDRCDLSLFQLGLRLLNHFLNERMPIPVAFQMLELEEFS